MHKIEIKRISQIDINELQAISILTFIETFSALNTVENMNAYLENELSISKLSMELENIHSTFYFAMLENKVVGYLKLNVGEAQTEIKDESTMEIERIYVLKEFHGQKVGQLLCDKALQVALQANAFYVWLGVWEMNFRAINFYTKNGFEPFDKHIFQLGNEEQTDIMMKRMLK